MSVKFEGIGFNSEWIASKTAEEVIAHEAHHGLGEAKLRELHKLCKQKHKPAKAEKPAEDAKSE